MCALEDEELLEKINKWLLTGQRSLREIEEETGLHRSVLHRHRAFAHASRQHELNSDERLNKKLEESWISGAEQDREGGPANVVDGLFAVARAIERLAAAVEKRRGDLF